MVVNKASRDCPIILQTGFRIFFIGAAAYAVLSMVFWYLFYVSGNNIFVAMPLTVWHGHEMIFGFTMAVVAGFLLTAVPNWTGRPALSGMPLLVLFLFWASARALAFMPAAFPLWPFILCNLIFLLFLIMAGLRSIFAVKQWKQFAVFSKLILIFVSACIFYVALANADLVMERKALRFCVYMLISLIFTIGRRILPFFIERGVGYTVSLRNNKWVDLISLVFMIVFSTLDIFWPKPMIIVFLCVILAVIHSFRLSGWYTPGIWKKPLLWILFVGYIFLIIGFVLKAVAVISYYPDDAALHAWTAGGIGLFTLGMMARVSWGHTGRNIAAPPRFVGCMFILASVSAVFRVFLPIINERHYIMWVATSQVFWILAFIFFLFSYLKVLISSRPDGKRG